MSDVIIVVPRRADRGHRDRLWSYSRAVWAEFFPDWPIIEGHHDVGPFNRSAAINRGAAQIDDWKVIVVIDSDVLPDPGGIESAVEVAFTGCPASGFNGRKNLTERGTELVLAGYKGSWERYVSSVHKVCRSGALAVRRDLWDEVGGFDELFVGWGFEDTAFEVAIETIYGGPMHLSPSDLWHLWHPLSPEKSQKLPEYRMNRVRRDRYATAKWDKTAVRLLLTEAKENATALPSNSVKPRATRIPRIIHRTVPVQPSEESEQFWRIAQDLHPGWTFMDHHDPLDPAEWPETSNLWTSCKSGAQKAGLIRLEALYRFGGVYLDSDVELYKSLEPLLALEGFAAWEDKGVTPDAVLGFRPNHPALAIMLEQARTSIENGGSAWESGPGVTTSVLPGRDDVLLLPPGSFYPYHYKEKHRRNEDHATAQPWAFGAHHWAHSWAGK